MKLQKKTESNKIPSEVILKILEGGQNFQSHCTQATGKESTQEQGSKPSLENLPKLPIFKVEVQKVELSKEKQEKIDEFLLGRANEDMESDYQAGATIDFDDDWEEYYENAVCELIEDFDIYDTNYELIGDFNKEDNPQEWESQKQQIINYLETL